MQKIPLSEKGNLYDLALSRSIAFLIGANHPQE